MKHYQSRKIGPGHTPLAIKIILSSTIGISLFSALLAPFFQNNYIAYFLGLSLSGVKNFFLWQFITYNFIHPSQGINFSFILELLFNMYLIWVIGTSIIERLSQIQYLILYFLSSTFAGCIALLCMYLGNSNFIFAGSTVALYATLIAWMMLIPKDTKVFLFFALPFKYYWLVLALIGFNLFTNLSNARFVHFFAYLSASIFTYFYSVIIWSRFSPFQKFNKMERFLIYTCRPFIQKFKRKKH